MKKEIKKYDVKSILRWIALVPALAVTWYAVSMVSIEIESWMVDIPAMTPGYALLSVIITLALLPVLQCFLLPDL